MAKIIIGLAGEMASGKGTVSEYLKSKYNSDSFRFSDTFRKILENLNLECSRKNMSDLSLVLRNTFGEDILAKSIAKDVKKSKSEVVALDGVRRVEDIRYLKENPDFKLVFVETDIETRHKRMMKRGENKGDNKKTFEDFKKDHAMDADSRIKNLKNIADGVVDNNGTLEDLHKQVDELIK